MLYGAKTAVCAGNSCALTLPSVKHSKTVNKMYVLKLKKEISEHRIIPQNYKCD